MNQFTSFKNFVLAAAFLLFIANFSLAQLPANTATSPQKHLEEINAQWVYHSNALPEQTTVQFDKDVDRIQYHLYLVVAHLRQNPPQDLSDKALENRDHLLNVLESYADAKVFPTNLYHSKRTPYFIDDYGVHCAVGYLIRQSGHEDLAQTIRKQHNYDYLADIKTAGILEWANEFGFTIDELKWIQPGYPIVLTSYTKVFNSDSGEVRGSIVDEKNDALISYGSFTSIDGKPMNGIIVAKNNVVSAIQGNFKGDIFDCYGTQDDLYVCGRLINGTDTMGIGHFYNGAWEFFKSPMSQSLTVNKIIKVSADEFLINLTDGAGGVNSSSNELWSWNIATNTFSRRLTYGGNVYTIKNTLHGTLFTGLFYHIKDLENPKLSIDDSYVIRYKENVFSQFTPSLIHSVEATSLLAVDSGVYLGFKTQYQFFNDSSSIWQICFYNVNTNKMRILVTRQELMGTPRDNSLMPKFVINDLSLFNNELLMFGGSFKYLRGIGIYESTSNLMGYDLKKNEFFFSFGPDNILSLDYLSDSLIYMTHQNSLTQMRHPVSVPRVVQNQSLSVYPNPFITSLTIEGLFSASPYKLRDVSGKIVQEGIIDGQDLTIEENVTPGVYTLTIETSGRTVTKKLVKQ